MNQGSCTKGEKPAEGVKKDDFFIFKRKHNKGKYIYRKVLEKEKRRRGGGLLEINDPHAYLTTIDRTGKRPRAKEKRLDKGEERRERLQEGVPGKELPVLRRRRFIAHGSPWGERFMYT